MTEKMYNTNNKSAVEPASFLSRFTQYDQRHQKHTIFIRRKRFNPLWRAVSNSLFLQKDKAQAISANIYKMPPPKPKVSNSGIYYAVDLRNNSWRRPYRKHTFFTNQWCFQKTTGINKLPTTTAIRRFLYRLTPTAIRQIVKVQYNSEEIFLALHTKTSVTFDIDGTVLTVYGHQQRAKVGYNPKKRGKKSYCLMLCFESNREFWYGSLKSGNISQVKVARHIIKDCLKRLPFPIYRIRVRLDAIFYSRKLVENYLDGENIGYTIETQLKEPILPLMEKAKYSCYKGDWGVSEFMYQPRVWENPHRFVVLRRPLPEDPEEKLQLKLFEMNNYGYRVLVTNLKLNPRAIWNFHSQRAQGAEQNIKELKLNYSLAKIPTKSYIANVAYLQILLLAFNIINWFKCLCLPKEYHYLSLQTIREQLLSIPARLTKTDNKNVLKFPAGYQYKELFNTAISNIKSLEKL